MSPTESEGSDTCGFTPTDVQSEFWRGETDTAYRCDRPVDDTEHCFWHRYEREKSCDEAEGVFDESASVTENRDSGSGSQERGGEPSATIKYAFLRGADLGSVKLHGTVFEQCNLVGADATDADLSHTQFHDSMLDGLDCSDQYIEDIAFIDVSLRRAVFDRARLDSFSFASVDLSGASFVQTQLRRPECLSETAFGPATLTGMVVDRAVCEAYQSPHETDKEWRLAAQDYHQLVEVARRSSLPKEARRFYISYKDAQRKSLSGLDRILSSLSRAAMLYGESIVLVLWWMSFVIGASTVFYWQYGQLVTPEEATPGLLQYFYFSVVTFVTLGYGDYVPMDGLTQLVVMIEALSGAVLLAVLVFVFGRRSTY